MSILKTGAMALCLAVLGLALSCKNASREAKTVQLDDPFTLSLGESAKLEHGDLALTFQDVLSDSRCPRGVECIWAGEALVALGVKDGFRTEVLSMRVSAEGTGTAELAPYQITALALAPYPVAGQPIEKSEYRLELKVETGAS